MSTAEHAAKSSSPKSNAWAHRLCWVLLIAAFATVCLGALITSYAAAMAVPDWPAIFGHNPLLYPVDQWFGTRDIFLVHTHRLFGYLTGVLSIVLAVVLWKTDTRSLVRWFGPIVLIGYCVQEGLGGFRVLGDEILLANLHGCLAAMFLAVVAALTIVTSERWRQSQPTDEGDAATKLYRWATAAPAVVYLQIILGTQLRYLPVDAPTEWFGLLVWFHAIVAATVTVTIVVVFLTVRRHFRRQRPLRGRASWLLVLVVLQVSLGLTGWVTRFGWPLWFVNLVGRPNYTVVAEGRLQVAMTTGHVVVGILCLLTAVALALWSRRLIVRSSQ